MKDSARPDPIAAAQRVKDRALDLAADLADGYRKSTRFFKLRAAVVGSWALLSVATLFAACPSTGAKNALGAEVQVCADGVMGTQVLVWNGSSVLWTDVVLTLDDAWRYETSTVRDGQKLVVAASKFKMAGAAAPGDLKPQTLTIECEQGKVTTPVSARCDP
jgi:hypothetical protein